MAKLCGINLIIFSNVPLPYSLQGIAKVDSEFVCAYHPAAAGLNPKHTINTFQFVLLKL